MQRHPGGALAMFWTWMTVVIVGFLSMTVVLLSGR